MATCTSGAALLRVPEDCATIGDAVAAIGIDGTIDIATGTYGLTSAINVSARAMTLRARSAGAVTLDGGGTSKLVKDQGNSGAVVFEGIRFVNGFTSAGNSGGAVTLSNAEASFVDCEFSNNRSTNDTTGGGAISLVSGARAFIVRSTFTNNSSINNGGAVYGAGDNGAVSLWVHDSTFAGNSTDVTGFTNQAAGGAIYFRNGRVEVADSTFDSNVSGWVGGAIYLWGDWLGSNKNQCPYDGTASMDAVITRSVFTGNRADDSARVRSGVQTQGGAIHLENCVRLRIYGSLFEGNAAVWGGALSSDHAALAISQSILRFNQAVLPNVGTLTPLGGGIWAYDGDSNNYPNGSLSLDRTLLEGGTAASASAPNAQIGGCVFLGGDSSKSTNLPVSVTSAVFDHCNALRLNSSDDFVRGGAIEAGGSDLQVDNALFIDNDCRVSAGVHGPPLCRGAGLSLMFRSHGSFSGDVVFAGETSDNGSFPGDYDLYVDTSTSTQTGTVEEWHESPPSAAAGILISAPTRAADVGAPFAGEAFVGWAFANGTGKLDGSNLSATEGIRSVAEGSHTLSVTGLSGCSRCAAAVATPVEPATLLDANPNWVASPGDPSTLSWTTSAGTFLAAHDDRGVGDTGGSGQAAIHPGSQETFRRLAITAEGGAISEFVVGVGGPPPEWIFVDGFESDNLNAWSSSIP